MPLPNGRQPDTGLRGRTLTGLRRLPLRKRLIISSLLGTIPLIILGMVLLIGRYYTLRDAILQSNLQQAHLAAAYTGGWLDGQVRTLRTLAQSKEVQYGTLADKQALAQRQLRTQSDWDSLWITDANGREIVDTNGRLVSVSDRPYFQQAKRTERPFVTNVFIGRTSHQPIVAIAYPILRNNTFVGIVAASVRPSQVQRAFSRVPAGPTTTIGLWGRDGRLIARTNTPGELLGKKYPGKDAERILSGRSGTAISVSPVTGERVLLGFAPVENSSWTVVASVPLYVTQASILQTMTIFIVLASLVLLVTLAWSIYSANIIADEVSQLAESAQAIGAGKLETRVKVQTGGELRDLADSLNKMAADLQVIDRLKSDLLSMVSHELKTPLTSIRTSIEMLASGMITADHPKYQELLDIADRQARRLQDMIENVLNVARLESGGVAVTPRSVRLKPIVDASMHLYQDLINQKGLTLTVDVPADLQVMVDQAKVTLALNNLVDNAVKFTDQGSITIRAYPRGGEAVISVTDTGAGLAPEVKTRLFERFYQAEPLLTRKAGGAGLGLFVTKAIIEAHHGHVFVESAGPGQGSTFGFTLPLA